MKNTNTSAKVLSHCIAIASLLGAMTFVPIQNAIPQENQDETFTLNLKNVDIRALIETVSERTGKNFIIDPRVAATVTVISSEPVSQDRLYDMFLSVLQVHGFAAVPSGQFTKIVPDSVGAQNAIPVLSDAKDKQLPTDKGDELITQVIFLQNIPASQLIESLRPLIPTTASISAESNSNSIVVTDRAGNIDKLKQLITMMDSL